MPGIIQKDPSPGGLTIKELHPTFGAEIQGVDFENLSEAQFAEIKSAMAKVRSHLILQVLQPKNMRISNLWLYQYGDAVELPVDIKRRVW